MTVGFTIDAPGTHEREISWCFSILLLLILVELFLQKGDDLCLFLVSFEAPKKFFVPLLLCIAYRIWYLLLRTHLFQFPECAWVYENVFGFPKF